MSDETTNFEEVSFLGSDFEVVSLEQLLDPRTNIPVVTLTRKQRRDTTDLSVDSEDQPGIGSFVLEKLGRFGLSYDVYAGERLRTRQSSRIEFSNTPENLAGFDRLFDCLKQNPYFKPHRLKGIEQIIEFEVNVYANGSGLLTKTMQYLGKNDINLRRIRAEKNELGGIAGMPEVVLFGEAEIPKGLITDAYDLRKNILLHCPPKSTAKARRIWNNTTSDGYTDKPWPVVMN